MRWDYWQIKCLDKHNVFGLGAVLDVYEDYTDGVLNKDTTYLVIQFKSTWISTTITTSVVVL